MRYYNKIIVSLTAFIFSAVLFLFTNNAVLAIGQWTLTEPLNAPHGHSIQMVKLQNNNPFIISGVKDCCSMTPVSEYYDVDSGQWVQAGDVNSGRNQYNPVLLNSGKVLIAGGWPGVAVCGDCGFSSAELYDPAANQWAYTGSMNEVRRQAVYIKLLNGKVLAISGVAGNHTPLYTTEIYDPLTEQWVYTGNVVNSVAGHGNSAVVLDDGRVLIVGNTSGVNSTTSQLYDSATGQWSTTGAMQTERHSASLVKLQDGRVLMIGGDQWGIGSLTDCEIYDPSTGQWTYTGSLNIARNIPGVVLLADGRVLAAGGTDNDSFTTTEVYDPTTGQWIVDAPLNVGHYGSNPVLLSNGKYLLAGGYDDSGLGTLAELYSLTTTLNQPPVLEYIGNKSVDEGQLLQFVLTASDPDGDNLSFSAANLPVGAIFDPQNATFSWTPGYQQEGNYSNIEFSVTDDGIPIGSDTEIITITVGDDPTPIEQARKLVSIVIAYDLPKNVENSYLANIKKVEKFIEEGKIQPAINQLNAFILKVDQDYMAGYITQVIHDNLISLAQALRADLQ